MKITDQKLAKRLAEDYLTGGMSTRTKARYERLLRREPILSQALEPLQNRLNGLYRLLPVVHPPARVWKGIEGRLFARSAGVSVFWSYWAVAASVTSLVLLGGLLALNQQLSAPSTQYVAVLSVENQEPSWVVSIQPGTHKMIMTSVKPKALDASQDYELWVIEDGQAHPRSLGLLPVGPHFELAMQPETLTRLTDAIRLAVTIEPAGGSPSGLPTSQPIVLSGLYLSNP
jgi:anti-sigma-K factor RskA